MGLVDQNEEKPAARRTQPTTMPARASFKKKRNSFFCATAFRLSTTSIYALFRVLKEEENELT
jgi:hypothetical protein